MILGIPLLIAALILAGPFLLIGPMAAVAQLCWSGRRIPGERHPAYRPMARTAVAWC